jgi:hypothetical protein
MTKILTIRVSLTPGVCRWCRCTYESPCANGCGWVDRTQTLCTECVPLETAMHTMAGRRELAEFVQEYGFLVGRQMPAPRVPRGTIRHTRRIGGK